MNYRNTLNLLQVRGGNYIKQTDRASTVGYQLQDHKKKKISDLDGKAAYVTLTDRVNERYFKQKSIVECGTVNFMLDGTLEDGIYDVEIEVQGHVFPSDDRVWLNVSKSHTATKIVSPEGFDLSMFLSTDDADKRYAKKIHTHILDEVTDVATASDVDILALFA